MKHMRILRCVSMSMGLWFLLAAPALVLADEAWQYAADVKVDVYVVALRGGSATGPVCFAVPNPGNATQVTALAMVAAPSPYSTATFTAITGASKTSKTSNGAFYKFATFAGPADTIQYTNNQAWTNRIRKGDALFVYVFRNAAGAQPVAGCIPHTVQKGVWELPGDTLARTVTIAASTGPRDIHVSFAISGCDNTDDDPWVMRATAGSVCAIDTARVPSDGNEAHLDTLTLHDVPGNITLVQAWVYGDAPGSWESVYFAGVNVWTEPQPEVRRNLR